MSATKNKGPWNTTDEIAFLEGLGKHLPEKLRPNVVQNRRKLLETYLSTMRKRKCWGAISRCEIEEYLCEELGVSP